MVGKSQKPRHEEANHVVFFKEKIFDAKLSLFSPFASSSGNGASTFNASCPTSVNHISKISRGFT